MTAYLLLTLSILAKALDICLAEAKELKYEDGITHYGNTSFHITRIVCLRSSSAFCSFSISHSFLL